MGHAGRKTSVALDRASSLRAGWESQQTLEFARVMSFCLTLQGRT